MAFVVPLTVLTWSHRYEHDLLSARALVFSQRRRQDGFKSLVGGRPIYIHPSSARHNVTTVEPKWLVEVALQFKVTDVNKIRKRKKQEKLASMKNRVVEDKEKCTLGKCTFIFEDIIFYVFSTMQD
jgi:hypothetical protein